ncbi:MAG: hypothetical protein ACRD15_14795 [Vicinamibacterales bacterium]
MCVLRYSPVMVAMCALFSFVQDVSASMVVRHMNLQQMCDAAGRIFRGTVLGASEGTVAAGGGQLSTIVYRIRVDEQFKGSFEIVKGQRIATLQMVQAGKRPQLGFVRHFPVLDAMPALHEGHDYLILATRPSAAGLSTTVGLKQGVFKLAGKAGQETAVNGNHNVGLNAGAAISAARGPVSYSSLRASIQRFVGR